MPSVVISTVLVIASVPYPRGSTWEAWAIGVRLPSSVDAWAEAAFCKVGEARSAAVST